MKALDLTIFNRSTVFDYVRAIVEKLDIRDGCLVDGYYRYVDNVYLYALMSDQYRYDIALICMTLTLVYFTALEQGRFFAQNL